MHKRINYTLKEIRGSSRFMVPRPKTEKQSKSLLQRH